MRLWTLRESSSALKKSWRRVIPPVSARKALCALLRRRVGRGYPGRRTRGVWGVFAAFSPGHSRSKIVQDKARYRFDRQAPTKPRSAGLFRLCGMLSFSRNCRISAIYMPPNAAVPTILPLFMRRGYQYGRKQEELRLMALPRNRP